MITISLPRSTPEWHALAHQAFDWWTGELSALMPKRLRRLALNSREPLILHFDGTKPGFSLAATVADDCSDVAFSGVLATGHDQLARNSRVRILLDHSVVLHSLVELPLAAETMMAKILAHQLERLVPLDPHDVSFVWHIAERLPKRTALVVDVTIVKNSTLEQVKGLARDSALAIGEILVTRRDGQTSPVWRLGTDEPASRRRFYRGLEAGAVLLCFLAYGICIARLDHRRDVLLERLRPAQAQIELVERNVIRLSAARTTLLTVGKRLSTPTPSAILDELTRRIPLDGSLIEFSLMPDHVEITGTGGHATALLSTLAASPLFDDAQFVAPITSAPDGAGEHFELSLHLHQTPS